MARTGSLRLINPEHEEAEGDNPLEIDLEASTPGMSLDADGTLQTEHGDGSLTFDFNPDLSTAEQDKEDFYYNLATEMDEGELSTISTDLLEGIDRDELSRKQWLDTRARGITLLGLQLEEPRGDIGVSSAPLEGMSTVRHPLLLEATIRFQATARGELLPADGPVKVRNDSNSLQPPPVSPPPGLAGPPGGLNPPPPGMVPSGGSLLASGPPASMPGGGGGSSGTPQSHQPPPPLPPGFPPAIRPGAGDAPGGMLPGASPPSLASGAPGAQPPQPAPPPPMAPPQPPPLQVSSDELASQYERDWNHYLTATATEYVPDTDRMLFYIGFGGDGFKKIFNCPLRRRPVSESVDAEDLIVSNAAIDLKSCGRITHRIKMRKSILRRMQIIGAYRDVHIPEPTQTRTDPVEQKKNEISGHKQGQERPQDRDYEIYETYCELELDRFAPKNLKGQGLPLPYRVTIEKSSKQILSIIRNWKKDDEEALPKQFFVQFPFIRGIGFYGLGFIHVLGNTTATLTAAWREMLDAGMFASFPGGLVAKHAARQLTNQFRCPPGGFIPLDLGAMQSIRDVAMPLPYKEVGPSFTAFIQHVEEIGKQLGQTADMQIGEGKQDAPVGTTLALIEQATKILDSAHKRLHWAQNEEFALLRERFIEDPEAFWRHNKRPSRAWDKEVFLKALNDYDLVPVADPNNPTSLHRMAKATAVEGLASKYPQLIDTKSALERVFRIAGIDTDGIFRAAPLPDKPDPRMVAIQQKAQSTAGQVQQQAQEAMARTQLELARLAEQAQDRQSRERIEQMKIQLETIRLREEEIIHASDAQRDVEKHRLDMASQHHKALLEGQKEAQKAHYEHQRAQIGMATDAAERMQDLHLGHQEHHHELSKSAAAHRQKLEHEREAHEQRKQHEREMHAMRLENERALAQVRKTSQNRKSKSKDSG